MEMDPRVSPMFRAANAADRFVGVALCALLSAAGLLDQVLADCRKDSGIDWRVVVAGRQLLTCNGKTREQLLSEGMTDSAIDEVAAYLDQHGLSMPGEDNPGSPAPRVMKMTSRATTAAPAAPASKPADPLPPGEPVFAGRPLSELAPLSDAELKKIEGIGAPAIKAIRQVAKDRGLAGPQ